VGSRAEPLKLKDPIHSARTFPFYLFANQKSQNDLLDLLRQEEWRSANLQCEWSKRLVLLDRDPPICRLEFRGSERGKTWQMVSDDVGKRPAIDLDAGIRQEIKEAIEDFERAKRGE